MHFFAAYEGTQQDTTQKVHTFGLFPEKEGVFPTPYRETLVTAKVTANLSPARYVSVRYGRNSNSQPYGAAAQSTQDNWEMSRNQFNSINVNNDGVLGGTKLNEFIFQYANFKIAAGVHGGTHGYRKHRSTTRTSVGEWRFKTGRLRQPVGETVGLIRAGVRILRKSGHS
jgi:hypothetical protein